MSVAKNRPMNFCQRYPLVMTNIAIENGPVEIVDLPIENGDVQ